MEHYKYNMAECCHAGLWQDDMFGRTCLDCGFNTFHNDFGMYDKPEKKGLLTRINEEMEYSAIHNKLIISQDELRQASLGIMYAMKKYRQSAGLPVGKREKETGLLTDFDHAEREMICSLKALGINVNAEWGNELDLSGS